VIAAIHGWCIGGGISLVSACDVRLCSQEAKFSLREVRLAIAPDLGALQRLPRIVGEGHARQLALTGEDVDAARAERMGLVNAVLPTPEALLQEARRLARDMAENAPFAVQGVKHVMETATRAAIEEGLRLSALWSGAFLQSEDFGEALAAFVERRGPRFQGK
jgi:enoyl-CoA hydratase